ncbi:Alpha/Beta hydrolase protein [Aspergillus pseudoustus]|uniref:Carboxylic ester hydrolase n=1 Tax=Aspergillus pseudoustus TaxID=1810923 RepID=A0ABR4J332_9EURO
MSLLLWSALLLWTSLVLASPIVDLGYARYAGLTNSAGVNEFLGMRFAQAPTGNLRWRAPQDPNIEGIEDLVPAQSFKPICIGVGQNAASSSYSEDCLYINVFGPANATATSQRLPVWVFIQGGGYGTNSNANYNGTKIIEESGHNIVFVNFNYRVGALGFLASARIRDNGALNVGLLDQRKALVWVKKNIHLFGGDSDHIVIHGMSAGGGSAAHHLTAYGGRNDDLFIGAVLESPFFPTMRTIEDSEFQFDHLVNKTGCFGESDELACLRGADLSALQKGNTAFPYPGATGKPNYSFLPVIDSDFVQASMFQQFKSGKFVRVPTLVGGVSNEGDTFVPNAKYQSSVNDYLSANFPHLTTENLTEIDAAFGLYQRAGRNRYFGQASAAFGNGSLACGGLLVSHTVSHYVGASKAWNYRYNLLEPASAAKNLGVPHGADIPAVFGVGYGGTADTTLGTVNADLVSVLMSYYISFIRSLDPNTYRNALALRFKPYGIKGGRRLLLQMPLESNKMESVPDEQFDGCKVWEALSPFTGQ